LTGGAPDKDEAASRKRRLIKGPEEFRENARGSCENEMIRRLVELGLKAKEK
jgi:hypothetical protein